MSRASRAALVEVATENARVHFGEVLRRYDLPLSSRLYLECEPIACPNGAQEREDQKGPTTVERHETVIRVVDSDSFAAACALVQPFGAHAASEVCVQNLASDARPGGGYLNGASAQEEALFRCSTYALSLDWRHNAQTRRMYPMQPVQAIYSPRVLVFREPDLALKSWRDCFEVNAVAVAALRRPRLNARTGEMGAADEALTCSKMRLMLRAAHKEGNRVLVLGAMGCGAFGNNPAQIARLYRGVLAEPEFAHAFKEIVFAVLSGRSNPNFRIFQQTFASE